MQRRVWWHGMYVDEAYDEKTWIAVNPFLQK